MYPEHRHPALWGRCGSKNQRDFILSGMNVWIRSADFGPESFLFSSQAHQKNKAWLYFWPVCAWPCMRKIWTWSCIGLMAQITSQHRMLPSVFSKEILTGRENNQNNYDCCTLTILLHTECYSGVLPGQKRYLNIWLLSVIWWAGRKVYLIFKQQSHRYKYLIWSWSWLLWMSLLI